MRQGQRYLIVTPYYKESDHLLGRCIQSVRSQTIRCDHLFIADGFPSAFIDEQDVRHIKLDRNHRDYGNTPRGIGCLIGVAEEYDGICLLDADNWLEPSHLEACLKAASSLPGGIDSCDYVVAKRYFRRPDETIMPILDETEHVDTNCFFFLPGSYSVLPVWASMPSFLSPITDRIFNQSIRSKAYKIAYVDNPTVNYHCLWEALYKFSSEKPPSDAKPSIDVQSVIIQFGSMTLREVELVNRLVGFTLSVPRRDRGVGADGHNYAMSGNIATSRNAECPCGSGLKYKHCHGKIV